MGGRRGLGPGKPQGRVLWLRSGAAHAARTARQGRTCRADPKTVSEGLLGSAGRPEAAHSPGRAGPGQAQGLGVSQNELGRTGTAGPGRSDRARRPTGAKAAPGRSGPTPADVTLRSYLGERPAQRVDGRGDRHTAERSSQRTAQCPHRTSDRRGAPAGPANGSGYGTALSFKKG